MRQVVHPLHVASLRGRDAGVTLIEMLVVLAILGASVGGVMLAMPQGAPDPTADREARLLQARLRQATEASLATLRPARMQWATDGYVFEQWDGSDWQPHELPVLAKRHVLTGGVAMQGDGVINFTPDALPPVGGPVEVILRGGSAMRVGYDGFAAVVEAGQ